jgi:hypothetical protein
LNDRDLLPIFPIPHSKRLSKHGLTGFQNMIHGRGIDWGRFIDVDIRSYGADKGKKQRLQLAYRIDPSFVHPLGRLPNAVVSDKPKSLGERNLLRSLSMGLPSGQDVARAMEIEPLKDEQIIIAKAVDVPDPADGPSLNIVQAAGKAFAGNCPLWTYVLAEAAQNKESVKIPVKEDISISTPKLGPVGGRIVAEVFLGLMFGDGASLLSRDPFWQPASGRNFALRDFVRYALGDGPPL